LSHGITGEIGGGDRLPWIATSASDNYTSLKEISCRLTSTVRRSRTCYPGIALADNVADLASLDDYFAKHQIGLPSVSSKPIHPA
jgi:hypothetical protein